MDALQHHDEQAHCGAQPLGRRTSSVVACRDTASCARLDAAKRCISGTSPTVDTVTCITTAEQDPPCILWALIEALFDTSHTSSPALGHVMQVN